MARRFTKVSEEEIGEAFFYPSDLVKTKTTIPLRVGEERWIYPPLFTYPSRDSCILFFEVFTNSNLHINRRAQLKTLLYSCKTSRTRTLFAKRRG